jgi:transposase
MACVELQGGNKMSYWATPPMDRNQILLFAPTLNATIDEDHPVRLFDDILARMDWSPWEARYHGKRGQPPIHPKIVAGVILYGMSLGLRSSRVLERACTNALDFIWLVSGRSIDHSTLCEFRTRFSAELKDLFKQIGRLAMSMGLIRLNRVGLDGTRVVMRSVLPSPPIRRETW